MWRATAFLVGSLIVVGAAAFALNSPPTTMACFSGQPPWAGELHTDLNIDPRIKTMAFSMMVNQLSGGAVRWYVNDPTGTTRWSGHAESPGIFESGEMPGSSGRWTINVISEADALTYGVIWKSIDPAAANDPICGVPL